MPLSHTVFMLRDARARGYAVGAYNVNSLDQVRPLILAADRLRAPILVTLPGIIEPYVGFAELGAAARAVAAGLAVPVGLHVSHGSSLACLERALRAGFTSVMFDGSKLPYEENVERTREAVALGHAFGAAVEGELGAVGETKVDRSSTMTDPALALDYVERTGVDILAVAIGNSHGFYKGEPKLEFDRLDQIRDAVARARSGCFLTLHGGTGIPARDMRTSIEKGISKICIYTEMCSVAKDRVAAYLGSHPSYEGNLDLPELLKAASEGFVQVMEQDAEQFMTAGKA